MANLEIPYNRREITDQFLNWLEVKDTLQMLEIDFNLCLHINKSKVLGFYDAHKMKSRNASSTSLSENDIFWESFLKPIYIITKTGRIEKFQELTENNLIKESGFLKNASDYNNAFNSLYKYCYKIELRRWRDRLRRNPNILKDIPSIYLKKIHPKLVGAQKIGLFD